MAHPFLEGAFEVQSKMTDELKEIFEEGNGHDALPPRARGRESLRLVKGRGSKASAQSKASSPDVAHDQKLEALKILTLALLREVEALGQHPAPGAEHRVNLSDEVRRFESDLIRSALVRTGGRQRQAARLLGMKVTTLHTKIKRYNIDADEIAQGTTELRLKVK